MIKKRIYLLLLLIPLLYGCKESDFNDLLDRQGDQKKELQELTELCRKLKKIVPDISIFSTQSGHKTPLSRIHF